MTLSPSRLASSRFTSNTFGQATAADDGLAGASQASSRAAVRREKSVWPAPQQRPSLRALPLRTDHLC